MSERRTAVESERQSPKLQGGDAAGALPPLTQARSIPASWKGDKIYIGYICAAPPTACSSDAPERHSRTLTEAIQARQLIDPQVYAQRGNCYAERQTVRASPSPTDEAGRRAGSLQ